MRSFSSFCSCGKPSRVKGMCSSCYNKKYKIDNGLVDRHDRKQKARERIELRKVYMVELLRSAGIHDPSPELIKIWRETLLVKRAAKKVQEALDERTG